MTKRILLLSLLTVVSCLFGWSQTPKQYVLPQLAPKSPNVESFERYGEVPVSMSTGIPRVTIPLWEVKVDGLTIPIELSYYNNGYKPKDIASWVGYGWNLQPGGAIVGEVQGIDDFETGGLYNNYGPLSNYQRGLMNASQQTLFLEDIIEGLQDAEFDQYRLSLLGAYHLFYFDTLKQVVMTPKTDLLLRISSGGFRVLDQQGNQYFFEDAENSSSYDGSGLNFRPNGVATTFFISRIVTKNGRLIRFRYRFFHYSYNFSTPVSRYRFAQEIENPSCPANGTQYADTHISQDVMLLDSIIYDEGYVKFNHTVANRQDLAGFTTTGVPSLESIKIVNYSGTVVREFVLQQSYFGSGAKLRLDGVQEKVGTTVGRKWEFTYFSGGGESYNSYRMDHWGYYNGQNNSSLLPQGDYASLVLPAMGTAVRTSDFTESIKGVLKSIKYPTGGSTEFEWERNQIRVPSKAYIENLSPFLRWKESDFPYTYVALADGDSENNSYGTFTLSQETECVLNYYFELDPGYVGNAAIVFTGPQAGVDTLFNALQTNCSQPSPNCLGIRRVRLAAGTYTWACNSGWNTYTNPMIRLQSSLYLTYSYLDPNSPVPPFELPGGRIRKIISRDSTGINPPVIKEYVYQDTITEVSFKNIPNYMTFSTIQVSNEETSCWDCGAMYVISGENVAPLAGSTLEYGKVTELFDSSGRGGKIEYSFSFSDNLQGDPFIQPQVRPFNTFWTAGSMVSKSVYKKDGNGYAKVRETINSYASTDGSHYMPGMKVGYSSYCNQLTVGGVPTRGYRTRPVFLGANRYSQTGVTERIFSNDTLELVQTFSYNSTQHLQLTEQQTFDSKDQPVREKLLYPEDYVNRHLATAGEALSIKKLADTNVIVPIETIKIKKIGGVDYVIDATLNVYRSDKPVLSKVYGLKSTAPILLSSFMQSNINGSGVLVKDANYEERILVNKVDEFGNVIEMQKKDDVPMVMLYDYKKMYVVAEVKGADSASVAYTSFESDGNGNWTVGGSQRITNDGLSGKVSYQLSNGAISKSGLNPAKVYTLTYWTKNAAALTIAGSQGAAVQTKVLGTWRCFSHKITGVSTVTLSGSAIMDEVRLYPAGAKMSTWSFEPMQGVTTECSPNSVFAYYEYDALGRLSLVRDQYKNILKKMDYQYNVAE